MNIEITADGSSTLYIPEMDEHYHSIKGALTESKYIFLEKGLNNCNKSHVNILEIGFGTGLNAILTLIEADNQKREIYYTTIEKYPLTKEIIKELDYASLIGEENLPYYIKMHDASWNCDNKLTPYFIINKINGDFTDFRFNERYDVVYFDAFAPEKQPEMWSQELFDYIYSIMNPDGILTTYCAKGVIRRMLQAAGFTVERLQGPPNGKREILRATKNL